MLVKWDPITEMEQTLKWWETQPFLRPRWDDRGDVAKTWAPPVNVYEDTEHLSVEIQLPGLNLEDISISVKDQTMDIHGERKVEHDDNQDGYHLREAQYGMFARRFTLPEYVKASEAKAAYEKGVLIVTVPKQEEAKPRLIPIQTQE